MKPCEYCVEEVCGGKRDCHCQTCPLLSKCYRVLRPTIRITNKCTQRCAHCCFSSSPESRIFMSKETAGAVAKFLEANEIKTANVMGGEFFMNPEWLEILKAIEKPCARLRLVTNGDWAGRSDVEDKLLMLDRNKWRVGVSKDGWHTNAKVEAAEKFLKDNGFRTTVEKPDDAKKESLVPVGRAEEMFVPYSLYGQYCKRRENMYAFLIDEDGQIYKCPFGMWRYADARDYLEGGFAAEFKRFNSNFYSIFVPSCATCIRADERYSEHSLKRE